MPQFDRTFEQQFDSCPIWLQPLFCLWAVFRTLILVLLGCIKGVIVLPFCMIVLVPGCFVTSVLWWPREFVAVVRVAFAARIVGPNAKVALILLSVPLMVAWPAFVLIGSLLTAVCAGFFAPLGYTVASGVEHPLTHIDAIMTAGVKDCCKFCWEGTREFWKMNNMCFHWLWHEPLRPYFGEPLDFSLFWVVISCAWGALVGVIFTIVVVLFGALKLLPTIAKVVWEWLKLFPEMFKSTHPVWWPGCIIGWSIVLALIPVALPIGLALAIIGAFGTATASTAFFLYTTPNIRHGIALSAYWLYIRLEKTDSGLNKFLHLSCLNLPEVDPPAYLQPYIGESSPAIPDYQYYNLPAEDASNPTAAACKQLASTCEYTLTQLVHLGWISTDDLATAEPYVFIGPPAAAVLQLVLCSQDAQHVWDLESRLPPARHQPSTASDGPTKEPAPADQHTEQTADQPAHSAAAGKALTAQQAGALLDTLRDAVLMRDIGYNGSANPVKLKKSFKTLKATSEEVQYMLLHAATAGGSNLECPEDSGEASSAVKDGAEVILELFSSIDRSRLPTLHAYVSAINSVSIALSKKPQFTALYNKSLQLVATNV